MPTCTCAPDTNVDGMIWPDSCKNLAVRGTCQVSCASSLTLTPLAGVPASQANVATCNIDGCVQN